MEQNIHAWTTTTKNIFIAVMISSLGTVIANLLNILAGLMPPAPMINRSGDLNLFIIGGSPIRLAVAIGYILYLVWLNNLRNCVSEKDNIALRQISNATLLVIIAFLTGMFYIPMWLDMMLCFIAYILMLIGFNTMRKSETMSEKAHAGFEQLFRAMLFNCTACGLILLFGWIRISTISTTLTIIAGILATIGSVFEITGWLTVKNSPAPKL